MNLTTINILMKLKNNSLLNKENVYVRSNKLLVPLLSLLYNEGLILSFKCVKILSLNSFVFKVKLRYSFDKPMFNNLKIISTQSKKRYVSYKDISRLNFKKHTGIVSTSFGLKTIVDCYEKKLGGTLLFVC